MLFVPLWFCTLPAVLSLRCRLFSQNNRPIYECLNVSAFGAKVTLSGSVAAAADLRGIVLPSVPPGTMTFKIAHTRIETLARVGNPEIVTLAVNFCDLRTVAADAFARSTNLKQIDLSHNLLTHLSFDALVSSSSSLGPPTSGGVLQVERLVLAYNRFETIPDLSALHALRDLDLSHNRIVRIPDGSLLLPRLEWIDLSHNSLSTVQRSHFGRATRILELDANPWNCDCALRDFVAFQRETLISRSLRCRQPPPLRGIKWDDLGLSDFACGPEMKDPLYEVMSVTSDDIVTLICEVGGDPTPTVFWRHNHSTVPLKSDSRITITSKRPQYETFVDGQPVTVHALTINPVNIDDENTYWCIARAGYNTVRKRFDLTLLSPQVKVPSDTDLHDLLNEGNEFRWSKDDEELSSQQENSNEGSIWESKEGNEIETVLAGRHPLWMIILVSVVVVAFTLLVVFCIFIFRMHVSNPDNGHGDQKRFIVSEQVIAQDGAHKQNSTINSTLATLRLHNADNSVRTELVNSGTSVENVGVHSRNQSVQIVSEESDELNRCCLDEWTPKAPLAQYDTDTSVLPIVQTSL